MDCEMSWALARQVGLPPLVSVCDHVPPAVTPRCLACPQKATYTLPTAHLETAWRLHQWRAVADRAPRAVA